MFHRNYLSLILSFLLICGITLSEAATPLKLMTLRGENLEKTRAMVSKKTLPFNQPWIICSKGR